MKEPVILVRDIEDFLEFTRLYRELQVRLTIIHERQKETLEIIKYSQMIATKIRDIKQRCRFETDAEVSALIRKYARN